MTRITGIQEYNKIKKSKIKENFRREYEIDRKTRKVMTMNKELHPRHDVDRLHVSRMEGGRGLIGCKMYVKAEENGFY